MTSEYQEDLIIQGNESIAVITRNGVVNRKQSVPIVQEIIFHDLVAETPKIFKLSQVLNLDYLVEHIEINLTVDDSNLPTESTIDTSGYGCKLELRRIQDDVSATRILTTANSGSANIRTTLLKHDEDYMITASADCTSLIFICQPVLARKPINF